MAGGGGIVASRAAGAIHATRTRSSIF